MSEAIRVVTRIRPLLSGENGPTCKAGLDGAKVHMRTTTRDLELRSIEQDTEYQYDMAIGPSGTQTDIHNCIGKSAVEAVLDGRNASVMAYGQTNSGKTYTMIGNKDNPGLIPSILNELVIKTAGVNGVSVRLSAVQIINELIFDLFDKSPMPEIPLSNEKHRRKGKKNPLRLREYENGPFEPIGNKRIRLLPGQVWQHLQLAESQREYAKTDSNECSSRSHSLYLIDVVQDVPDENYQLVSNLTLVDLAGSENVLRSGVVGKHLTETANINRSLSALKNFMSDLLQQQQTKRKIFINCRNSSLTKLLRNSIGGNARSTLICNISPSEECITETRSTMEFGQMSRGIKCKVTQNIQKSAKKLNEEIKAARLILSSLRDDIRRQERQLPDLRSFEERMSYNGIPNEFTCPLTARATAPFVPVFKTPVISGDGFTYECDVLLNHWKRTMTYPSKSQLGRGFRGEFIAFPNKNIRSQIQAWNANRLWPSDIIIIVLQYSCFNDIRSCLSLSSRWYEAGEVKWLWESLFKRDFPTVDVASHNTETTPSKKTMKKSKKNKENGDDKKKKKVNKKFDYREAYFSNALSRNEQKMFRSRTYGVALSTGVLKP